MLESTTAVQPQINPNIQANIFLAGNERTPVIVIDQFLSNVDAVNQDAQRCRFSSDLVTYYPGVRAALDKAYVQTIVRTVAPHLQRLYKIPAGLQATIQPSYFSLITVEESDLKTPQKLPHFDTCSPYYFAIMHYINAGAHGGTGFFRHKATGFETVSPTRENTFIDCINTELSSHVIEHAGYIKTGNETFDLIAQVDYKPNRLVIYPGSLLHSGLLKVDKDIDPNPRTGRLTANIFVNFA